MEKKYKGVVDNFKITFINFKIIYFYFKINYLRFKIITLYNKMEPSKYKIESLKTKQETNNTHQVNTTHIMASVANFKSAVIRIRDILRGPGMSITGMDSMRHICLYLLSRYMTKDKVSTFAIPSEFAWENLLETARTRNGGVQKALDCFFHREADDCLVYHFDRLFGTDNFSFDIKNPPKHKEILEILDNVSMSDVDCQMDTLGWVYEQHLKTGASSAGRDLGQFFTDRFICEYMTTLCTPGFKYPGVPESVCDPSMGTGGFLTSFIKYYKKHHATVPIDWSVQQQEIHGNDTDPRVAGVARLNLFMETGGSCSTNLRTHDSLYGDLTQTGYDVILANMPFGLKGIIHADCCERVKDLKIRGTKSEPLFLQLMMVSLNRGGRCAVVVPEGMLNNSTSCHDGTRKYLLDNFELKRVIKMRGKFFMNTGIEPSILFFENTGNPTTTVEFWDVVKGSDGSIEETMVLSVPRERFDASCSLDMRRYQEVKEVADSTGFPMVKLGDIIEILGGKRRTVHEASDDGEYDFITCSIMGTSRINVADFNKEAIIINAINGSGRCRPYYSNKYSTTTNNIHFTLKSDCTTISLKYVHRYLELNIKLLEEGFNGGNQKKIGQEYIKSVSIIVPPLAIQHEIVATLDRIYQPGTTELAETLKLTNQAMDLVLAQPNGVTLEPIVEAQRLMRKSAQMVADVKAQMVADVKAQMVAIVKAIVHGCKTGTTIGNLYDTPSCKKKFNSGDMDNSGDIPFFNGKFNSPVGTHSDYSFDSEHEYFVMIKDGGGDHSSDSVGMGKFFNVKGKTAITSHNLILVPKTFNEALHKFMRIYLYCYGKEIRDKARYSLSLGSISVKDILNFPVPNMTADQLTNANIRLDALQSQLTALENLGKQAEDNARFILESYLGSTLLMPTAQSPDAHSSTCKADKDGVGCTCSTSRSQIVEDEDEKDEKSKHLEPAVEEKEEKAAQASGGSRDLTETELSKKYLPELKEIAKNLDVKFPSKINKGELVQSILKKQAGK